MTKKYFILIIILLTTFSLTVGQSDKVVTISFDGVYETKCEFEDKDDDEGSQYYLRFYPDGKVISVGTDCEGTADELKDWFHLDGDQVSKGIFEIKGSKINFSTTGKTGAVKYSGQLTPENTIKIKWKSLINGEKGRHEYRFIKMTGLK
jgi:hypothetical protein